MSRGKKHIHQSQHSHGPSKASTTSRGDSLNRRLYKQCLGIFNIEFIKGMERPPKKIVRLEGLLDTKILNGLDRKSDDHLKWMDVIKIFLFLPIYKESVCFISPLFYQAIKISYSIFSIQILYSIFLMWQQNYKDVVLKHMLITSSYMMVFAILLKVFYFKKQKQISQRKVDLIGFAKLHFKFLSLFSSNTLFSRMNRFGSSLDISMTVDCNKQISSKLAAEKDELVNEYKSSANYRKYSDDSSINLSNNHLDTSKLANSSKSGKFSTKDVQENVSYQDKSNDDFIYGTFYRIGSLGRGEEMKLSRNIENQFKLTPKQIFDILVKITRDKANTEIYMNLLIFSMLVINILPLLKFKSVMNSPSIINIILMICESIQRAIYSSIILMFLFLTGVELKKGEMIAYLFNCMTSPYMTSKLGMFYLSLDTQDNIKLWIIVKSMLKQRSYRQLIDGCISTSITLIFVFVLVIGQKLLEFEKEKSLISFFLFDSDKITCEILCWTLIIGAFVLQYSTDLNEIYRKHQVSRSILLTETINIHTSPSKNTNTNERKNVLDLLKNVRSLTGQMESPYRITSLSANPIICNAVRFIVIAVVSALISDLIGTKITLTKIFK